MTKKTATIRILDEVNVFVGGLAGEHQEYLYKQYGVHAPNYFFNPKYKLGQWDGMIRYFTKSCRTYLYLLDDILPRIARLGYTIEINDQRRPVPAV